MLLAILQLFLHLYHLVLGLLKLILSLADGFVEVSPISPLLFFNHPKLLFKSSYFILKLLRAWFWFLSWLLEELLKFGLD